QRALNLEPHLGDVHGPWLLLQYVQGHATCS
ncbi:MAG: hypothetical protein RL628_1190, partial [Actinomycetota bacterium]